MTKKRTLVAALFVAATATAMTYWLWTRTPEYSLRRLRLAVRDRDLHLFEKHFDVRSVSTRFVDDVMDQALEDATEDGSVDFGSALAAGIAQNVKPTIVRAVRDYLRDSVASGTLGGKLTDAAGEDKMSGLLDNIGANGVIWQEARILRNLGDVAIAALSFRNDDLDSDFVIELKFVDKGRYWQATEFNNARSLMKEVGSLSPGEREEEKTSPDSSEKDRYIAGHIDLYEVTAGRYNSYLEEGVPGVKFKLKNRGARTLAEVKVTVYFQEEGGATVAEETFYPVLDSKYSTKKKPLKPGYIWQMEGNKFYPAESVPSEWAEGQVRAIVTDIEFADPGTTEDN